MDAYPCSSCRVRWHLVYPMTPHRHLPSFSILEPPAHTTQELWWGREQEGSSAGAKERWDTHVQLYALILAGINPRGFCLAQTLFYFLLEKCHTGNESALPWSQCPGPTKLVSWPECAVTKSGSCFSKLQVRSSPLGSTRTEPIPPPARSQEHWGSPSFRNFTGDRLRPGLDVGLLVGPA